MAVMERGRSTGRSKDPTEHTDLWPLMGSLKAHGVHLQSEAVHPFTGH